MDAQTTPVPQEPEKKNTAWELHSWFRDIVFCAIVVTLLFAYVVRLVNVDGSSMYPTLHDYDKVALRSAMLCEPEQGDIIVFRAPGYDVPLVKRVIATEGQTVDIDFVSGVVYVDGVALEEGYVNTPTNARGDLSFPQTVAEGCVFVLGDNRNDSSDSRFSRVGQVSKEQMLGEVMLVLWPLDRFGGVE